MNAVFAANKKVSFAWEITVFSVYLEYPNWYNDGCWP